MANSGTPAELKNCKLENPSAVFRPLSQYLGSDKPWVLSSGVTYDIHSFFPEHIALLFLLRTHLTLSLDLFLNRIYNTCSCIIYVNLFLVSSPSLLFLLFNCHPLYSYFYYFSYISFFIL